MLEELYEAIKDFTNEEIGVKSIKVEPEEILQRIKDIDDGDSTSAFIYISDNGQSISGSIPDLMNLLSLLVQNLEEKGMEKDLIKKAVEIGLLNKEEKLKMLKEQLEKITKYMEEENNG